MSALKNSDMLKGSALELWINVNPGAQGGGTEQCIGFATSHSINVTTDFLELSTKSHGDFSAVLPTITSWEITAEYVYATTSMTTLIDVARKHKRIKVKFAEVQNYAGGGAYVDNNGNSTADEGIVDNDSRDWTIGNVIAYGEAYISNYTVNADSGSQASISVTIKGIGSFTSNSDN